MKVLRTCNVLVGPHAQAHQMRSRVGLNPLLSRKSRRPVMEGAIDPPLAPMKENCWRINRGVVVVVLLEKIEIA